MKTQPLSAEIRKIKGRKVKNLRQEGLLPANVFGKKVKSQAVQLSLKEFEKVFSEVGETGLIELSLAKEKRPVLVHNIQYHPVSDEVIHVDFLQVDLKEKVEAEVPVEVVGESPVEKQGIGTVVQYINEVKVEALPTDLPEKFEIDAVTLTEVDQAVYLKDLKVNTEKVKILGGPEEIVVKVEPPQKIEEEQPVSETPEGEAIEPAEGQTEEGGEAPAPDQETTEKTS